MQSEETKEQEELVESGGCNQKRPRSRRVQELRGGISRRLVESGGCNQKRLMSRKRDRN